MARDALSGVTYPVPTPQTQPVPGRTDQVKNNAGGYVFKKDDAERLADFLVLGTTGGTYYVGQDKLTAQNAELVLRLARERGVDVVSLALDMTSGRPPHAPKPRASLFALGAVSAFGNPEAVQAVKPALVQMARTTDMLSQFFGYRKQFKSKKGPRGTEIVSSRAFRSALTGWLLQADADNMAFRMCKARQRKTPSGEALDVRDILRIARPTRAQIERAAADRAAAASESERVDFTRWIEERDVLFGWLAGKKTDAEAAEVLPAVSNFLRGKAVKTSREAVKAVTELRIPWEFLPSEVLSDQSVWEALAETVGITALIRNLARMTRNGAIRPFGPAVSTVTRRLTDQTALNRGRVHPMDVYLALLVYKSGRSQPNPKAPVETWTPHSDVVDALEEAYELSFGSTQPSGRKYIIGVDSSGSMSYGQVTQNGARLGRTYNVACAIALTIKRIEGENVHIIDVDTSARPSKITKRTRLAEIQRWDTPGGGTDLSLPVKYATQYDLNVDGFALLTDNETWYGSVHPFQALEHYRSKYNPRARFADITMVPNSYSIVEPGIPGVVNMIGLDASIPQALTGFFRGSE